MIYNPSNYKAFFSVINKLFILVMHEKPSKAKYYNTPGGYKFKIDDIEIIERDINHYEINKPEKLLMMIEKYKDRMALTHEEIEEIENFKHVIFAVSEKDSLSRISV